MKIGISLIAFTAVGVALADEPWAYVPASREARTIGILETRYAPTEEDVSLVGASPAPSVAPAGRHVIAVPVPAPSTALGGQGGREGSAAPPIPEGSYWPDASGKIIAVVPRSGSSRESSSLGNPWEVRTRAKSSSEDSVFLCGGFVVGGEGGPVAILNGRLVKRGSTLGGFAVSGISAVGVVLERNGSFFVLPFGRRTSIATVEG